MIPDKNELIEALVAPVRETSDGSKEAWGPMAGNVADALVALHAEIDELRAQLPDAVALQMRVTNLESRLKELEEDDTADPTGLFSISEISYLYRLFSAKEDDR